VSGTVSLSGARIAPRTLSRVSHGGGVGITSDGGPQIPKVGERLVRQRFALGAKLCNGAAEVDGVPEDDGGDREVEAGAR
jgi:hypothetical protein